jgi:hypothetical protein
MFRLLAAFALAALALSSGPAAADDKKEKVTTWVREANGVELKFELGKETGKFHVFSGENGAIITGKIKMEKDVMMIEVTNVEEKGNFTSQTKKGDKVSFKWVVKDDTATLSDLKGDNTEDAKAVVEGEYKMKK